MVICQQLILILCKIYSSKAVSLDPMCAMKIMLYLLGWIRAQLAFAIVRASMLCVHGSRNKWRSLGLEDGAAIDLN